MKINWKYMNTMAPAAVFTFLMLFPHLFFYGFFEVSQIVTPLQSYLMPFSNKLS